MHRRLLLQLRWHVSSERTAMVLQSVIVVLGKSVLRLCLCVRTRDVDSGLTSPCRTSLLTMCAEPCKAHGDQTEKKSYFHTSGALGRCF